jgi:hypothetical protein
MISLLICSLFANAQPVLNAADFGTELSGIGYSATPSSLSQGNDGPDQVWDFSGLTLTQNSTTTTIAVASAPLSANFPSANYCWKITNNTSISGYTFFSLSNSSFESLGLSVLGQTNKYTDTSIMYKFPYTYGTVINDTYKGITDISPKSFTTVYDAYGTLITPLGTYTNVIRQKKTEGTTVNYIWIQTNPFFILMEKTITNGTSSSISVFKNTSALGVNQIEPKKAMAVFPNPTHAELNLQLPDQQTLDRVAITDITGKIVLTQCQDLNQINVSDLANGMYFIEAHSGNEKFLTKFIKN